MVCISGHIALIEEQCWYRKRSRRSYRCKLCRFYTYALFAVVINRGKEAEEAMVTSANQCLTETEVPSITGDVGVVRNDLASHLHAVSWRIPLKTLAQRKRCD